MRIGMVGTGYVGLVTGVCFAEFGFNVVCIDTDQSKIDRLQNGECPIFEPGLETLLQKQIEAGRITFSNNISDAMQDTDAVFIAVGTPPHPETGEADLKYVHQVARQIAEHLNDYKVIVTKSTVPVGTAQAVEDIIKETHPDGEFDVVSNPEFLREGAAVNDFMKPDRVVVGTESPRARKVLEAIYRPLYLNQTPILFTRRETSEIIKYAANAFLATKITFINEIADLCEKAGGDVQDVARALGLDGRISAKFLHSGPGYGGSCFPKDTLALVQTGESLGAPQSVVASAAEANENRKRRMADKIITACGGDIKGKTIGILGVAFKPNTDDIRDAPSLTILPLLQKAGAIIQAYDPAAMNEAQKLLENINWKTGAYETAENADAIVILTEWNAFRGLDLSRLGKIMKQKTIIDLRNIYKPEDMSAEGFQYASIGRSDV